MSLNQLLCSTIEQEQQQMEGSPVSSPSSPLENEHESLDSMPKRKRASAHQKAVLMHVFKKNRFPETSLRIKLAKELGMTPRSVQVWFQNQRQRTIYKNEANAIVSSSSSPSCSNSPSPVSNPATLSPSSTISNSTRNQLVSSIQSKNIKPRPTSSNASPSISLTPNYPFQAFGLPPIPRLDNASPFYTQQQQQQQQNKAKISFLLNEVQEQKPAALSLDALSSAACFFR
jgi:hypothetical protein